MRKTVEIVRPEGLADHVDLHQVVCVCGYEGQPSSDRGALITERNMHACPKPQKQKAAPHGRRKQSRSRRPRVRR